MNLIKRIFGYSVNRITEKNMLDAEVYTEGFVYAATQKSSKTE